VSLFDGLLPWWWVAGLVVFGLTALSCYRLALHKPRGQRSRLWRCVAASSVAAAVCLVAIITIAIAPVWSIGTIAL